MINPSDAQRRYWEDKLKRLGLTMDKGRKIGRETLTYGHLIEHFGLFEGSIVFDPPTGERRDEDDCTLV